MVAFQCPTCRQMFHVERREDAPWRPFCSQRCKLVDLGRWLDGSYRISEPLSPQPPTVGAEKEAAED
ncbi:MAG: DNA gyrase inhibitor YacG [Phycisphaerales bacterium]|nr:DNA gyrase inhibitor YacG [Phycisphaerales bacterium]